MVTFNFSITDDATDPILGLDDSTNLTHITGTISGTLELNDNQSGQTATSIIVTSAPAALGFDRIGENLIPGNFGFSGTFDVTGGVVTANNVLLSVDDSDLDLIDIAFNGTLNTTTNVNALTNSGQSAAVSDDVGVTGNTDGASGTTFIPPVTNTAPTITTSATVSVEENQTAVIDINATDDIDSEGSGLTYSLTGGADQALFNLDNSTGVLTFAAAPDFENPGDANGDNDYLAQVTVTDSGGLTDVQDLTVSVTDVAENTVPIIISGETSTSALTINAPTLSQSFPGYFIGLINNNDLNTTPQFLSISAPTTFTGINLTSFGRTDSAIDGFDGSVWRLRNGTIENASGTLTGFKSRFSNTYNLPANTDTFVISPISNGASTHILTVNDVKKVKAASNNLFNEKTNSIGGNSYEIIGGSSADSLSGARLDDTINGNDGDDTLRGRGGRDILTGGIGDDRLFGNGGNDILNGDADNDTLRGGRGSDILTGGTGIDRLFGGGGNDIFVIEKVETSDRVIIRDYVDGSDSLGLSDGLTFSDLTIANNNANTATVIRETSTNNILAVLSGIDSTVIDNDDFVVIASL